MKGLVRIGGALILGVFLILGAFFLRPSGAESQSESVVVVNAPERTSIETLDSNGDGVPDWKEELSATVFETIQTPSFSDNDTGAEELYEEPTTLTGQFSIAFVKDYLQGKTRGLNFDDPTAFVGNAVAAIERSTQSKQHSRLEFPIVETTGESLRAYGNILVEIHERHEPSERIEKNLTVLQRAIEQDDPQLLESFIPIEETYQNMIVDMLNIRIPTELAALHLELLNLYEAMASNINAMQLIFDDPLLTLAKIEEHTNAADSIIKTMRAITKTLTSYGVVYTKEEPGSKLYLFDI